MMIGSDNYLPFRRLICVSLPMFLTVSGCFGGDGVREIVRPSIDWTPETYVSYFVDTALVLDGLLDDSAWSLAPWSADFVDIQGRELPLPRYRTRVKMLWNVDYLYIGAEMEEPHVWGNLTERDAVIFHDNDFEVFIDPDSDTHNYYELEVNALATEWDLMLLKPYRAGGPAIDSWDIQGLVTAVNVDGTINNSLDVDQGWTVEIAIPWGALAEAANKSAPPANGDQWRVNFSRVEYHTEVRDSGYVKRSDPTTGENFPEDNWVWSPQGLIDMHYPEMWGVVQFSESSAGSATEVVQIAQSEKVRHGLYEIYFEQHDWFARHGRYARTLSELEILDQAFVGYQSPPTIGVTQNGFEITRSGPGGVQVHIDQNGRSWVDSP